MIGGNSVKLVVPVGFSVQSFLLQASDGVIFCFMVNSEVSSLHKDDKKLKTTHYIGRPDEPFLFIQSVPITYKMPPNRIIQSCCAPMNMRQGG